MSKAFKVVSFYNGSTVSFKKSLRLLSKCAKSDSLNCSLYIFSLRWSLYILFFLCSTFIISLWPLHLHTHLCLPVPGSNREAISPHPAVPPCLPPCAAVRASHPPCRDGLDPSHHTSLSANPFCMLSSSRHMRDDRDAWELRRGREVECWGARGPVCSHDGRRNRARCSPHSSPDTRWQRACVSSHDES